MTSWFQYVVYSLLYVIPIPFLFFSSSSLPLLSLFSPSLFPLSPSLSLLSSSLSLSLLLCPSLSLLLSLLHPSLFSIRYRPQRVKIKRTNRWTRIRSAATNAQTITLSCSGLTASRQTSQHGISLTNQILPPISQKLMAVINRVLNPRTSPQLSPTRATYHCWRCTTSKTVSQTLKYHFLL